MPVAFIKSIQSACRCHFYKVWGSLIPQPSIDVGEAIQIKLQAIRVNMTLMVLQNTVFKMTENWQVHAKTDMPEEACLCPLKSREGQPNTPSSPCLIGVCHPQRQARGDARAFVTLQ